ncbi:hypothetical protein [Nocardia nova]|uniref:hypothetical protein n=2 Tax=Nocardia nova TaxID=37330 RepID=UPI002739BD30|nr:hypothetical protein [Nocardia nova]
MATAIIDRSPAHAAPVRPRTHMNVAVTVQAPNTHIWATDTGGTGRLNSVIAVDAGIDETNAMVVNAGSGSGLTFSSATVAATAIASATHIGHKWWTCCAELKASAASEQR